jgi:hypothetical protein
MLGYDKALTKASKFHAELLLHDNESHGLETLGDESGNICIP